MGDSSKKYDFATFIGRLQPPHKAHIDKIKTALSLADKAIVILGSARCARNIKNPWTAEEREEMLRSCFSSNDNERILVTSVRDHYYSDNNWIAEVQQKVRDIVLDNTENENPNICLVGMYKDHSSYYLDLFPQWKKELASGIPDLNATDIRNRFFNADAVQHDGAYDNNLQLCVLDYMKRWSSNNFNTFIKLTDEWKFIKEYKEMWAQAPYPVTFVTTDAVVVKAGHVLMVRRKFNPGKGLLALPGGFVQQGCKIFDSALNELKEETRIKNFTKEELAKHLKNEKVFDHPDRSLRGRTITHGFYFELPPGGDLPLVKGDDDAERAVWIPLADLFVKEQEIYEDHVHIVSYFTGKGL